MKDEFTNEQKKDHARLLFTYQQESIANISKTTGITEDQIKDWIKEDKWNVRREANLLTKDNQLHRLYNMLLHITDKIKVNKYALKDIKDLDIMLKLTACIRNLEDEDSIAYTIDVANAFTGWLKEEAPKMALPCANAFEKYINYLERKE
jgi:hypothetical protein